MDGYARQIPLIGEEGQEKLMKSRVLVVGAGGLGSVVITYLVSAGIGKIGIVDGDVVEEHNLQRQFIHAGNVGKNKALSAMEFVERLNPDVEVEAYPFNLNESNIAIAKHYDVVVACPDNFETRLILNDFCVRNDIPMVHGAIYGFEGEVTTVVGSPCYRCLYSSFPKQEERFTPVFGFTCGVAGSIQCAETIKVLLGMEVLRGKLLRFDLRSMEFFTIEYERNPNCLACKNRKEG
ncbi:HesA/MoeB/ThiF family protein [Archaeoglobus profundus]|uniref:UBA/THIF-type NAD/FAD binding protein n=1 Tax=Archaeoglobus profundus (strain DSM 5631 / JCM 9629 / NBRC 100127 / Av18) TaxID=572546 RepID=D2RHM0_ARCPA|nr:HesA/MoeB/ThiF family protein [Archaeoglobus profundus]ADB57795.1 UBA/THIF-type NAD/FAD binding protein [Archaeoglobus profundus DSM 5631]